MKKLMGREKIQVLKIANKVNEIIDFLLEQVPEDAAIELSGGNKEDEQMPEM